MKIKRVTDVHTEHCCARHGCKYDWHQIGHCTVWPNGTWQSFPCEFCEHDIAKVWEIAHLENRFYTLAVALRSRIEGLPDHPWIPGANFKDGELISILVAAERVFGL